MNVLSLFDGMSCGQQALDKLGIKVDNYFASEIDKYAIQATMANYPNTKQLGSVVDVDGYSLPKIDLMIGGSPCQSFSFAGKRKGMSTKDEQEVLSLEHYLRLKAEGYEFEGQSYLFWEYMRLLNEVKPTYFLLENVMMGEKWEKVLTKAIGVNPIEINSSKLSAQNRRRLYWTNIGMAEAGLFGDLESIIKQPIDKKILLKDILQKEVDEKYFLKLNANQLSKFNPDPDTDKAGCLTLAQGRAGSSDEYMDAVSKIAKIQKDDLQQIGNIYDNEHNSVAGRVYTSEGKSVTLSALGGGGGAKTGLYQVPERKIIHQGNLYGQTTRWGIYGIEGISPTITASMGMGGGHVPMIRSDVAFKDRGWKLDIFRTLRNVNPKIIAHDIPEMVSVRKHEVDVPGLQALLNDHKKNTINLAEKSITINEIVEKINFQRPSENHIAKTEVEHWFRTDTYFSIPSPEYWMRLKEILGIRTDEFDAQVMEFIEKESVFEKTNRVYDEEGLAPTLTSTGSDERVLVRNNNINNSQSGAVHSIDDKSVPLCANGGGQGAKTGLYLIPNEEEAVGLREVRSDEARQLRKESEMGSNPYRKKDLDVRTDGKVGTLGTSLTLDNAILLHGKNRATSISPYQGDTLHYEDEKMQCLPAQGGNMLKGLGVVNNSRIRRLTPIECCRLQTVKDDYFYKDGKPIISETQIYKCCGNGWTVDVVAHIFSYILK